ncbi:MULTISPECIES: spore coat protein [Priestia]|uniref:spore coat protein n=1 Tax=Priestia TaxID=2800373 RepID=UPI000BF70AEF|nr:spore coat protein [Priestia megaterium]MDH6655664.1 spore coat protein B [Bacillus sp. PvP124]MBU8586665.1 spore coat protein [Priestia megaterium]MED4616228.1 spore coat protein [Priestia megaterium]PET70828.1 spore coat protein [Priestia megaterium]PFK85701.1 spore coat protein [Priestia megaterium]
MENYYYYYGQNQGQDSNPNRKRSHSKNANRTDKGYSSQFKPLKGRMVTVYRGGPESKTGYLLDVQSDYLILAVENDNNNNNDENNNEGNSNQNNQNNQSNQNNQNNQQEYTVVYYHLSHVKSITEDAMSNSAQTFTGFDNDGTLELYRGKTFASTLSLLKSKYVQINQGGPEKKAGQLLDVLGSSESAYLVLLSEDDGIVYINVEHVKSISEYQNNNNNNNNNNNIQMNNQFATNQEPTYMKSKNFNNLFTHLSHKWVSINGGGPEAVEGVLVQSRNGTFTLVQDNQVLRLQPRHVKTICVGAKGSFKQNNNQDDEQKEENTNAEDGGSTEGVPEGRTGRSRRTGSHSSGRSRRTGSHSSGKSRRTDSHSSASREQVIQTKNYRWKA